MSNNGAKSLFKRGITKHIATEIKEVTLDPQQLKAVRSSDSNTLVVAGAGSGKTSVLTQRLKYLVESGVKPSNIIAITFTNMASEEMKERLQGVDGIGDAFIGTIHSFANKVMKLSGEVYRIYDDEIENDFMGELINKYAKFLTRERFLGYKDMKSKELMGIVSDYEVQHFLEPSERCELHLFTRRNDLISDDLESYGLAFKDYPETISSLCKARKVITFDELLIKAEKYFRSIDAHIEHVLVDEFQDVGTLEFQFIEALQSENYFLVGDDWQCQPRGTRVTMEDRSLKNIEEVKVGDRVLSCDIHSTHYYRKSLRGKGKSIIGISEHTVPSLVTIVTDTNRESSYTYNHRCFARIHFEGNEDKSVVYIMQNAKGQYRVGSINMNDRNFGVRGRMNTEGGIRAWILDVYETKQQAWLAEQICAYKFGIPQITWTYKNIKSSEKDIDALYKHLENLESSVSECLEMFGRDIHYPIFVKDSNTHFSKIHVTEVHACNLIQKVMDVAVPYFDELTKRYINRYEQITHTFIVDNECHKVYGLKVEDTETYVADGILTHNSIYGWKGGNVDIFLKLISDGLFSVYYLTNNYRNGRQILSVAGTIINQVSHKIDKAIVQCNDEEGEVTIDTKKNIGKYLSVLKKNPDMYRETFILVRTNKDLYTISDCLDDYDIPHTTFKREGMSLEEMRQKMSEDKVKLLTVHVSKGLEADNVILYGNFPIMCPRYMKNEEERKVMYVGITRARKNLCILN